MAVRVRVDFIFLNFEPQYMCYIKCVREVARRIVHGRVNVIMWTAWNVV